MTPRNPTELAADHRAFAGQLRAELAAPETSTYVDRYAQWRGVRYSTEEEQIAADAQLLRALYERDWNRFGWPTEVGGLGGDVRHRAVLYEELVAAGLTVPQPTLLLETLGPPLVKFAPALAADLLPRALAGEEWWGQGFSEPEAGSDLASLRTRAVRDGDHYVVSGQKLWTSHGAGAARYICLVRTGSAESRHRGLSMIVIDRDLPGVSVRPIAIASGRNELAEVFFDDVRVPADHLIGEENRGWQAATYLLQFERSVYAWQSSATAFGRFRALIDDAGRRSLTDGVVARIGALYADLVTLRARSAETLRRLADGAPVGPEASVDKIALARVEIGLYDLAADVYRDDFTFGDSPEMNEWRDEWWYSRSATILGGSAEVQRTILADHVLKLPKEAVR
ncbi:acyl-CoA dehydrogenase family protein [Gordonia alkanivorans]|uniref:acyl-CoA dehydrogenase family protein n=1 Tax=Gordonia alkanivorans TaxID=84096 RepID=UPI002446E8A0|nr:acyl-CoA dehydrogenase family protein [Gordonia alkanivorans]MDH3047236.1 acyl-CoA dehydrogenase family protein [Gordonia alkanivorans]